MTLKPTITIRQAQLEAIKELKRKKISSAHLDTEVLLSFSLKKPKEYLYTYPGKKLTPSQLKKFQKFINRRLRNEPMAYILNHKEFFGLDFYVDKKVLIPRPETEILVEEVLELAKKLSNLGYKRLTIGDIGTGSGCIAITLAKFLPKAKILATEISSSALKVAKINALKHKVHKRIKFLKGSLLNPLKNQKIDILVANLPYLNKKQIQSSELKYEPIKALKNHKHFERLLKQAPNYLNPQGQIFLEIGDRQAHSTIKKARKYLQNQEIIIKKDLAGKNRVVLIST